MPLASSCCRWRTSSNLAKYPRGYKPKGSERKFAAFFSFSTFIHPLLPHLVNFCHRRLTFPGSADLPRLPVTYPGFVGRLKLKELSWFPVLASGVLYESASTGSGTIQKTRK